jgi:hypothetical protein
MIEPHVHLAFAPRGAGLLYAVAWFAQGDDVLGWFAGEQDGLVARHYFWLEQHYAASGSRSAFSASDDLRGPWVEPRLGQAPVSTVAPDEPLLHALAEVQERFVRHWLFADDGSAAAARQAEALRARGLPVRALNPRPDRLGKFTPGAALWIYDGPGADRNLLDYLSRRWPLEHRVDA